MSEKRKYARRNYYIDKNFQSRFIVKFCLLVFAGTIVTIGLLYYFSMQSTTVSLLDSRVTVRSTADFIFPILIQTIVIVMAAVSVATVVLTMFVSHKIAGPIYRFRKVLEGLQGGNFEHEAHIRQEDQFHALEKTLNSMIVTVRDEVNEVKQEVDGLNDVVNHLNQDAGDKTQLAPIKEKIKKIKEKLEFFKT